MTGTGGASTVPPCSRPSDSARTDDQGYSLTPPTATARPLVLVALCWPETSSARAMRAAQGLIPALTRPFVVASGSGALAWTSDCTAEGDAARHGHESGQIRETASIGSGARPHQRRSPSQRVLSAPPSSVVRPARRPKPAPVCWGPTCPGVVLSWPDSCCFLLLPLPHTGGQRWACGGP